MNDLVPRYEVTSKDEFTDKLLRYGAVAAPPVLAAVPALLFFVLFLFSSATPTAAMFFFLSIISLIAGFVVGLGASAGSLIYRARWLTGLRERIAVDGIRADEVKWFNKELKTSEKRALKEIKSRNLLLADAYTETLASRLTATRIVRSSGQELVLAKRRKNKLKYLKSENMEDFKKEVDHDIESIQKIRQEAKEMELEAESRLQMIEAASRRGTELAGNELALKKLSARSEQLPLALEEAKMEDQLRREITEELEKELEEDL
ncbi:MAG: hypothetical protein DWQ47_04280 [Acidobacteria bacterium]|mgnify:CR=1 FL=1|nr:MAG: hypothetical protein DWQ32_07830 [Acidobacteriota bacterium]REK01609.1 MAG: hypothetical protein DWQ38_04265 [Acidobacteriota bacterium]REK14565.1 MAG: hypothetical protein DWQ43_13520 [Acidobacteriota bacterium]REK45280.1 MAG: hypothetical protein DWQ47_04280 [Acidobacteriota bacterium]